MLHRARLARALPADEISALPAHVHNSQKSITELVGRKMHARKHRSEHKLEVMLVPMKVCA